jgi:hypothetical protein
MSIIAGINDALITHVEQQRPRAKATTDVNVY